ncbi:hypothetical protein TESG_04022 [Trichophyton tonsurans CBS 112818]|uniref:Uncharacterized protein n=2 Tax=Trichophyton TaxID=5550 RepID=F2Q0C2_TRIEC|nr:hypothetical protein TESG_04022 [Trichophyton tonsurans CBS 112818]EGE07622.1 hypothetical protein TEQG_06536 [Trichophyton equinum CBS 127.97]
MIDDEGDPWMGHKIDNLTTYHSLRYLWRQGFWLGIGQQVNLTQQFPLFLSLICSYRQLQLVELEQAERPQGSLDLDLILKRCGSYPVFVCYIIFLVPGASQLNAGGIKYATPNTKLKVHDPGDLFGYTSGRELIDEKRLLEQRHVKFNIQILCSRAANIFGS